MKNEALIWSLKWLIKPICSLIAGILIQFKFSHQIPTSFSWKPNLQRWWWNEIKNISSNQHRDMTTMLPCIGSCDWETQWRMYFVDPNLGNWSTHSTHPPEGAGSSRGAVLRHHFGDEVRALMLSAKQVVSGSHFKSAVWPGWGKPTTSQY